MSIQAKKSLGQNFLKSGTILDKIINAGNVGRDDPVLEIGPGEGALTEKLLNSAKKVVAIEKDDRLIKLLQDKFAENIKNGSFELIHADVLDIDLNTLNLKTKTYKLIANIPYYITGQIFRKFLSGPIQPSKMVVLVQKEVAQRAVARDGKESLLSISIKIYGEPKMMGVVARGNFNPVPNVDSAILLVDNISKNFFTDFTEEVFFKVLKAGFAHKRKQLLGNLKDLIKNGEKVSEILKKCKIDEKIRAEDLKKEDWAKIVLEFTPTPTFKHNL